MPVSVDTDGDVRTDAGLCNLPFHDADQNRIWVAISALAQDLLASCARLALPPNTARYETKRRYRA